MPHCEIAKRRSRAFMATPPLLRGCMGQKQHLPVEGQLPHSHLPHTFPDCLYGQMIQRVCSPEPEIVHTPADFHGTPSTHAQGGHPLNRGLPNVARAKRWPKPKGCPLR